jgi:hypothetical protein
VIRAAEGVTKAFAAGLCLLQTRWLYDADLDPNIQLSALRHLEWDCWNECWRTRILRRYPAT